MTTKLFKSLQARPVQVRPVIFIALFLSFVSGSIHATEINTYRPFDIDFKNAQFGKRKIRVGLTGEYMSTHEGYDLNTQKQDLFKLYETVQSASAMLRSNSFKFPSADDPTILGLNTTDPTKATLDLSGRFTSSAATLWAQAKLPLENKPGTWFVAGYLPLKSLAAHDIIWKDLTDPTQTAYINNVTSKIHSYVKEVGGLDINDWRIARPGDTSVFLGWYNDFVQNKNDRRIKRAIVNAKIGISIPTGETRDEDMAFSIPTGFDGAWGLPASLSLDFEFTQYVQAGLGVDWLKLFDHTKVRRFKTDKDQTEYLLLNKGTITKKHGGTWRFNLYAKLIHENFAFTASYHFLKHMDDTYFSNDFNNTAINTSESIKEWTTQDVVLKASYTTIRKTKKEFIHNKIDPAIHAFVRIPMGGRRIISGMVVGGELTLAF